MKKLSSKTWTGEVEGVTGLLVVTITLGLEATVVVVDGSFVDFFVVTVVASVVSGMVVALVVVDLVVDSVVDCSVVGFGVEVVVSGEDGCVVVVVDVVVVSGVVDLVVGFCVVGFCVVVVVLVVVGDVTPAVVVVSHVSLAIKRQKKYFYLLIYVKKFKRNNKRFTSLRHRKIILN